MPLQLPVYKTAIATKSHFPSNFRKSVRKMKSVHFTFRRKHIIRNNDVISHLESSFSFSKHFALLFGSHKNSVKLCDRYKSVFYAWRDWGQNVNDVPLLSYTGAAPIYISIHSVQRSPFPHILTSICFVSYNFTEFIY